VHLRVVKKIFEGINSRIRGIHTLNISNEENSKGHKEQVHRNNVGGARSLPSPFFECHTEVNLKMRRSPSKKLIYSLKKPLLVCAIKLDCAVIMSNIV
jgi:hypothetical protein